MVDCLNCELGCNGGTGTLRDKTQDEIESAIEKRNIESQKRYKEKGVFRTQVNEIARSAEDLNRLTNKLNDLIGQFHIGAEKGGLAVRSNGKLVHGTR